MVRASPTRTRPSMGATGRVAVGCTLLLGGAAWTVAPVATSVVLALAVLVGVTAHAAAGTLSSMDRRAGPTRTLPLLIPPALVTLLFIPSAAAVMGLPRGASDRQGLIHDLYVITVVAAIILTVLTIGIMLFLVWRYRDRGETAPRPKTIQSPLSRRLLVATYTLIPTLVIFGIGAISFDVLDSLEERPEDATVVEVTAVQFAWRFAYPDGSTTWNDLYMAEGDTVVLRMTSEDVIHSLYIPEMGVKMDVNPGMTTETWFRADEQGTYSAPCAEWCGVGHPEMYARVMVLPPGSAVPPPEATGAPPT